jgi:hypothetical protein
MLKWETYWKNLKKATRIYHPVNSMRPLQGYFDPFNFKCLTQFISCQMFGTFGRLTNTELGLCTTFPSKHDAGAVSEKKGSACVSIAELHTSASPRQIRETMQPETAERYMIAFFNSF